MYSVWSVRPSETETQTSLGINGELELACLLHGLDEPASEDRSGHRKDRHSHEGNETGDEASGNRKVGDGKLAREHQQRGEESRGDGLEVAVCVVAALREVQERGGDEPREHRVEGCRDEEGVVLRPGKNTKAISGDEEASGGNILRVKEVWVGDGATRQAGREGRGECGVGNW